MNWRKREEEVVDMTTRLRQVQQLLEPPAMVAPRSPADDMIEDRKPLIDVEVHQGRMYVAGHEPHFRPVTLLQHVRPRESSDDEA